MLIHTTLYPKIHCTHKVNSSVSESTTPKDVPFHSQMQNELKKRVKDPLCSSNKFCFCCTRRHFMAALGAAALLPIHPSHASDVSSPVNPMAMLNRLHPPRPDWYEEFYATAMNTSMKCYEAEIEAYKSELFANLRGQAKQILEIGIGTGPNLKYYASEGGTSVYGVDPNRKMEKYAQAAAETAGLPAANFKFLHAVSESLPLRDASVDAVIGTLVLCSVSDVNLTLQEVRRVLKPGGIYLFVEHVAAADGTALRFVQGLLDPLQQAVADGCHLTRKTGKNISEAGFSNVDSRQVVLSTASLINPHVIGIARN
ncbi:methyltransferase-like protein 7B isoform X1 [Solanum pennellii]|uniref:Methyltransferase-like protein 7B isoform X1 n=1 Tax=Solanum pennellii TaxID=28526 RepID=A0ABM1GY52_SOLPN|nr:methyltransferase-like protein 7B isoform X1 [Solanum pennellii]